MVAELTDQGRYVITAAFELEAKPRIESMRGLLEKQHPRRPSSVWFTQDSMSRRDSIA